MSNFNIGQRATSTSVDRAAFSEASEAKDRADANRAMAETLSDTVAAANETKTPPTAFKTTAKSFEKAKNRVDGKTKGSGEQQKLKPKEIRDKAADYHKKNEELDEEELNKLLGSIQPGDSEEEITKKVTNFFKSPYLAHDALSFLEECTSGDLQAKVKAAKGNFSIANAREIQIGQSQITDLARGFSKEGLASPTELRGWYHATVDSTPGQIKTADLFLKLIDRFGFGKMVKATNFFLVALGADLRNKGIEPQALADKVHQVRAFQAIINVFRMSSMRMRVVPHALKYYANLGFSEQLPPNFDYQSMGKTLMSILQNRHISKDTILQTVRAQGFGSKDIALTVVVQQMSLMLKDLDPNRLFTTESQRNDAQKAFIDCLTDQYANAQPEEKNEWLTDVLPKDLNAELSGFDKDFGSDEAKMGRDVAAMRVDPETADFIKACEQISKESVAASKTGGL